VQRQANLLEIVAARHAPRCFAGVLNGWQQQCHQYADDRDDHQQLDQGETLASGSGEILHKTTNSLLVWKEIGKAQPPEAALWVTITYFGVRGRMFPFADPNG
jgi:hypothetical protein